MSAQLSFDLTIKIFVVAFFEIILCCFCNIEFKLNLTFPRNHLGMTRPQPQIDCELFISDWAIFLGHSAVNGAPDKILSKHGDRRLTSTSFYGFEYLSFVDKSTFYY